MLQGLYLLSGTLNSKLCEFGESVDGLMCMMINQALGTPLLYWFLEVLTSPEGTFSAKENWKSASWITLGGISCDNLCSLLLTFLLWLIMSWASIFQLLNSIGSSIIFYFQLFRKFGIHNLAHNVNQNVHLCILQWWKGSTSVCHNWILM